MRAAEQERLARGAVSAFLSSFGERVFFLACHAAVPVVLNPELLHLLRVNFFFDEPEPLPYTAESDILLSPLCNELGGDLYEIPPYVRDVLLRELATTPPYGEPRIREVASFLLQYSERFSPWRDNQALERGQQLTSVIFLDPERAKDWLGALDEGSQLVAPSEREWFIAMRSELLKLNALLDEARDVMAGVIEEGESSESGGAFTEIPPDVFESLPFPYSHRPYSPYEPVTKNIRKIRVLVVNDLLREESDISVTARHEWGEDMSAKLERERYISGLALESIVNNIKRLVEEPEIRVAHLSDIAAAAEEFHPEAIVLSGTLSDFDYYNPEIIKSFCNFIHAATTPILAVAGGHLLVGMCFGTRVVTLEGSDPAERREGRTFEYQYRFIKMTEPEDPIFRGIHHKPSEGWQDYTTEGNILRVWQNHGLMLDRLPEGFELLATAYLCRNQMMVKRTEGQLIYTVQFHLEKSFQDLTSSLQRINPNVSPEERKRLLREEASSRTLWAHPNESRDGRLLFENFLRLALEHRG